MSTHRDTFDFVRETANSIGVRDPNDDSEVLWFPKSVLDHWDIDEVKRSADLEGPEWIFRKKGVL